MRHASRGEEEGSDASLVRGKTLSDFQHSPSCAIARSAGLYSRRSLATAQDAVWNDSMNTTTKDSGRRIGGFSKLEIPVRARGASESDPQNLAATIEENRVKLEKGWKELDRLNRLLTTLDAATTGVGPKAPHSAEPTVPTAAGPSPAAVERA
jgi:hypothetical protein